MTKQYTSLTTPPDSSRVTHIMAAAMQSNLVSIIILTFNQLKYTKECVESIRKHTPEPHEIIFVDNGSTDGTGKWLKKLVKNNSNYKLIENKKNLGFSKGCNQGIEASSGEYILLLNNDVVVTENWLAGMLECLKQRSGYRDRRPHDEQHQRPSEGASRWLFIHRRTDLNMQRHSARKIDTAG